MSRKILLIGHKEGITAEWHLCRIRFSLLIKYCQKQRNEKGDVTGGCVNYIQILGYTLANGKYRLLDSLVVECWLRVREVPGSIPNHGTRHTKDVIKMVPVVPLFSTQH